MNGTCQHDRTWNEYEAELELNAESFHCSGFKAYCDNCPVDRGSHNHSSLAKREMLSLSAVSQRSPSTERVCDDRANFHQSQARADLQFLP